MAAIQLLDAGQVNHALGNVYPQGNGLSGSSPHRVMPVTQARLEIVDVTAGMVPAFAVSTTLLKKCVSMIGS